MIRVGIIGAGLQGKRRAQALKECGDELLMVADTSLEKAKLMADHVGCRAVACWQELVSQQDIDSVIICTPPDSHLTMCISALKQGKHVLCEKPLTLTLEESQQLMQEASQHNLVLQCGFNLRHHPGIVQARYWLDEGFIGEPKFLRCRYGTGGRPGYEKEWRANPKVSGGGQLMDQGIHILDLARYFLGDFSEVFGFLQTSCWDICVEDNAFCLLRNEKGKVADIHVSWTQWKNLFSLELFGEDGYILIEGLGGSYGTERAILGRKDFFKPFSEEIVEFRGQDNSWRDEWLEFTSVIKENRQPSYDCNNGLEALKLAFALYESAEKNCVIKLK